MTECHVEPLSDDTRLGCMCRELNAADEGLWQHGKALHAAQLQRHKEGGRLEAVVSGVYRLSLHALHAGHFITISYTAHEAQILLGC